MAEELWLYHTLNMVNDAEGTTGTTAMEEIRRSSGWHSVRLKFPKFKQLIYDPVRGGSNSKHLPCELTLSVSAAGDPSGFKFQSISYYETGSIYFDIYNPGSPYLISVLIQVKYKPFLFANPKFATGISGGYYTNPGLANYKVGNSAYSFFSYTDCKPLPTGNYFYDGTNSVVGTLKGNDEWKKTVSTWPNKYLYNGAAQDIVAPGSNPLFDTCLFSLGSYGYSRDADRFTKYVNIYRESGVLKVYVTEHDLVDAGYDRTHIFEFDTSFFRDGVLPDRLVVVVQAAGGGGSGGARGGGGSGAMGIVILNTEETGSWRQFQVSMGDRGNYGAWNGSAGNADSSTIVYMKRSGNTWTNTTMLTLGGGKGYADGQGDPGDFTNGTYTVDNKTIGWLRFVQSGRAGGGHAAGSAVTNESAYLTKNDGYKSGKNVQTYSHSGGAKVGSGDNTAGGGGASFFANGRDGSTGENTTNAADGAGGGGATWTKGGSAGGSSYLEIWY